MLNDSEAAHLLARYGYLAILVGTMLEGETVVLVAGFLAHQGYLSIPLIIVFAVIGSTISDQGLFFLSRFKGEVILARFPKLAAGVKSLACKMRTRQAALNAFALLFRFFYGFRNIAPVFLGMSDLPSFRFAALNAVGAILWATLFSFAGYAFGKAFVGVMGSVAKLELIAIGLIVFASLSFVAFRRWRKSRKGAQAPSSCETGEEKSETTHPPDDHTYPSDDHT